MERGVNRVIIIGNLGRDPETKFTSDGKAVTTLSLATSESWKDKNTGEKQERTEWHNITFFKELADIVSKYVKKGSKIYIEGKLKTDKYTDKEGIERYRTHIIANTMQMLDSNKKSESNYTKEDSKPKWSNDEHNDDTEYFSDDDIPF